MENRDIVTADDDNGEDRNASITHKFFAGRKYHIRLQLYYPGETGITSVLITEIHPQIIVANILEGQRS